METELERFDRILDEVGSTSNTMHYKFITLDQLYKFFKAVERDCETRCKDSKKPILSGKSVKKPQKVKINPKIHAILHKKKEGKNGRL